MRTAIAHLYIPLYDNDGQAFPPVRLSNMRSDIIARFGGLTSWYAKGFADGYLTGPAEVWETEPIEVWEVVGDADELVPYLMGMAGRIKRVLEQDSVFISVAYGDVITA